MKDVRSQKGGGGWGSRMRTFCIQGGVLQMRNVHTFWCEKHRIFLKFMVCPHGQVGLSQCRHFSDKGGVVNFLRFCADVLYEQPLLHKQSGVS